MRAEYEKARKIYVRFVLGCILPLRWEILFRVWACRTFDRDSPVIKIIDRYRRVASPTPFDVLKVTPLTDTA